MAQVKYKVLRRKWLVRHLPVAVIYGLAVGFFWWMFALYDQPYYVVAAIAFSVAALQVLYTAIVAIPTLTVGDGTARFGRTVFNFADVVDVHHRGGEYTFMLATRRRAVVKVADFSGEDKKAIDRLFAAEVARHLTDDGAREKIASASQSSGLEFSIRAAHTVKYRIFYVVMTVYLLLAAFFIGLDGLSDYLDGDPQPWTLYTFAGLIALWFLLRRIEVRAEKNVFSFRNDTFTLERKGRVVWSFPRTAVEGVGIAPDGKALITFRLRGETDRKRLPLAQFGRQERKFLKNVVRSIFFMPEDSGKTVPGLKVPFKI